jgi:hypothetical protein
MDDPLLTPDERKAVAVLANATARVAGRNAPVVASLRQLLGDGSRANYDAATQAFDRLSAGVRRRIAESASGLARRKLTTTDLPGLLGILSRG